MYEIIHLSNDLIYIRWWSTPQTGLGIEARFINEIKNLLDRAQHPIYFISDLRSGRIADIRALQRLGQVTQHVNCGGSTAFSGDPVTKLLVNSFHAFAKAKTVHDEMQLTPEAAIGFLEHKKPGISNNINWAKLLNRTSRDEPFVNTAEA